MNRHSWLKEDPPPLWAITIFAVVLVVVVVLIVWGVFFYEGG